MASHAVRAFAEGGRLWVRAGKHRVLAAMSIAAALLLWHGHATSILGDALAALLLAAIGVIGAAWPVLDPGAQNARMAPLIALVGCDGSGKTTLSADLLAGSTTDRQIALCYLGLGSGAIGEKLKRLPLIGPAIEQKLARKAKQARSSDDRIPGLPTALVVYAFSLTRLRRFRRMLALRRAGVTVITDRYPQIEMPGFYDGPGLSAARAGSRLVAALADQERRMYIWMAAFHPDVVIRLNVDAETAFSRKPDHNYDLLRQKVDATAVLRFSGARIVDLDSCRPYAAVRTDAERVICETLQAAVLR